MSSKKDLLLLADGSCRGNPGPGGWSYVLASSHEVFEGYGSELDTTNNRMELSGLLFGIRKLNKLTWRGSLQVHLDSQYVLSGASAWIFGWQKRGWKTGQGEEVKNSDLWQEIAAELLGLKGSIKISWYYVRGHTGVSGNERADQLASMACEEQSADESHEQDAGGTVLHLWSGLDEETFDPNRNSQSKRLEKSEKKYYLSCVEGKIYRDDNWQACEARVKGRPHVKYKKVGSEAEEKEVLRSWGIA